MSFGNPFPDDYKPFPLDLFDSFIGIRIAFAIACFIKGRADSWFDVFDVAWPFTFLKSWFAAPLFTTAFHA